MLIDHELPLVQYITSTPMNARKILVGEKLDQFKTYLQAKITEKGSLYITKDSGFFYGKKQ